MNQLLEFGGRLHPLILHAPIGLFIGLVTLEIVTLLQRGHKPVPAPKVLVWLASLTAVISAATGLLLAREDGYGGDGLELHRWGGIVGAVLSVAMALLRCGSAAQVRIGYHAFLVLFGASLIVTGHLGASITHGEGFLTEPFRGRGERERSEPNVDENYAPVARILQAKCVSCHGPDKRKGGLALHSFSAMMQGGESGPAVVMGDLEASELLFRVRLPLDDEDHMPPAKKQQLTEDEIATLEAWVMGRSVSAAAPGETPVAAVQPEEEPAAAPEIKLPDAAALRALAGAHVHAARLTPEDGRLWIDFSTAVPPLSGAAIASMLEPLAPFVAHLTLARSELPPGLGAMLGSMPELERLDLRGTAADDSLLASVEGLPRLAELVLSQTGVSDAGLGALGKSASLRRVYLWGSKATAEGVAALRAAAPKLAVDTGDSGGGTALETEPELKLSSDAPAPGQAVAAASLTPVNTTCPVTGSPVDSRYLVVYDGKVIGFCCPNCPRQFWEDPAKFAGALPKK